MERRSALKSLGGILLAPSVLLAANKAERRPVLRVAHLTDIHLKDKFNPAARFVKCLHNVQQQSPKIDMILNGGDIVFDMNKENIDIINAQWKLVNNIMQAECNLPVSYCLGNHDIWWTEKNTDQAFYGKQYALYL